MKVKIFIVIMLLAMGTSLWAVPAWPGWITMTQPDSTEIELKQIGDEFYHYWINRDGKEVEQDEDGWWREVTDTLTTEQRRQRFIDARRRMSTLDSPDQAQARPGHVLVILVNFRDLSMQTKCNHQFFDDLLNKEDSISVRQYFIESSDGHYRPTFDVYGPVTLDSAMAYYGAPSGSNNDIRPGYMVKEACEKVDKQGCDFSIYDEDGDGKVDNVYIIFAGHGQAAGGGENTIWPHKWNIYNANGLSLTLDGKKIYTYSCSSELRSSSGTNPDGIGTFCHEFSHVLGLPDYYDTNYGDNYDNDITPGKWSLMDHGNYNNSGQSPPLYSIFDKCYMGWAVMPALLPQDAKTTISMPVGSTYARHVTGGKTAVNYTSTDTVYYLENRQKIGFFDKGLPYSGMLIWKVLYKSSWTKPNNTTGLARYTLLSATGSATNLGTSKDCYPGPNKVTKKTIAKGCELSEIALQDNIISFKWNGGVPDTIRQQQTFAIAPGQAYTWRGQKLTTAGIYVDTVHTEFADTILTLSLNWVDSTKTIIYTATSKLDEVSALDVMGWWSGLHVSKFDQDIALHYFSNGVGTIIFNKTLTKIGSNAFYKCTTMSSITLPSGVSSLGYYALQKCTGLRSITSLALTPPSCESTTFKDITKKNITLHVYPISLSSYKKADEWKDFFIQSSDCDEPVFSEEQATITFGELYEWRGQVLEEEDTYTDTLSNHLGCDSIIYYLHLTVLPDLPTLSPATKEEDNRPVIRKYIYQGHLYIERYGKHYNICNF